MKIVSKVYTTMCRKPINKQAAQGFKDGYSLGKDKDFRPLMGKGCFRWAYKNCRTTEDRKDLVDKIARGMELPCLEVIQMVDDWIEKGLAVNKDGKLVLRRRKGMSGKTAKDCGISLVSYRRVKELKDALTWRQFVFPCFFMYKMRSSKYDVCVFDGVAFHPVSDWVKEQGGKEIDLSGDLSLVACETLIIREHPWCQRNISGLQIYSVSDKTEKDFQQIGIFTSLKVRNMKRLHKERWTQADRI